jgi:hypothetical protein
MEEGREKVEWRIIGRMEERDNGAEGENSWRMDLGGGGQSTVSEGSIT